ncbi:MAG: OmpA family protein [Candidatus Adiutrix sp.]|jgi:peptidoglycan-associated lipoprotein|nr:OmpA family protein [Candidatus Adiutrix sp.]
MKKALMLLVVLGIGALALQGCGLSGNYPTDPVLNELVKFGSDKYNLTADAQRVMDYKIAYLKHYPGSKIFVVGHTDITASDKYNLDLGRHRAEEIQRYLVNNGINPKRIELMTEGERRPVAPGASKAANEQNRRAEFYIIGVNTSN